MGQFLGVSGGVPGGPELGGSGHLGLPPFPALPGLRPLPPPPLRPHLQGPGPPPQPLGLPTQPPRGAFGLLSGGLDLPPLLLPPGGLGAPDPPLAAAILRLLFRWVVGVAFHRSAPFLSRHLEAATGSCWSDAVGGLLLLPDRREPISCRGEGRRWEGFRPSPQAFALVHCGLGLAEEVGGVGEELVEGAGLQEGDGGLARLGEGSGGPWEGPGGPQWWPWWPEEGTEGGSEDLGEALEGLGGGRKRGQKGSEDLGKALEDLVGGLGGRKRGQRGSEAPVGGLGGRKEGQKGSEDLPKALEDLVGGLGGRKRGQKGWEDPVGGPGGLEEVKKVLEDLLGGPGEAGDFREVPGGVWEGPRGWGRGPQSHPGGGGRGQRGLGGADWPEGQAVDFRGVPEGPRGPARDPEPSRDPIGPPGSDWRETSGGRKAENSGIFSGIFRFLPWGRKPPRPPLPPASAFRPIPRPPEAFFLASHWLRPAHPAFLPLSHWLLPSPHPQVLPGPAPRLLDAHWLLPDAPRLLLASHWLLVPAPRRFLPPAPPGAIFSSSRGVWSGDDVIREEPRGPGAALAVLHLLTWP
ncbi:collagen alpha-1(III) chain-like [Heliangelus exortis]|uniref:collagen alpha-1(III) chain-like n=1 Tax=Heliangelus exortis TaxID=472823 RepID=UPI003A8D6F31